MNWDKYKPVFTKSEFVCKCGCGLCNMNVSFLDRLHRARLRANIPFVITSGARCKNHNLAEGGKDNSDHLTGEGADIFIGSGRARWIIEEALREEGFTRFGHGATFFHVGCRTGNPERVIWTY